VPVVGEWLSFSLSYNTGVAFGLFSGMDIVPAAFVLAAVALVLWAGRDAFGTVRGGIALAPLLGGATGNAIDRARFGHVVDFIELPWWPVFNFADTAIVLGALTLAWQAWRLSRRGAEGGRETR